ncbi:PaaI family thioesterase [Roseateles sp.]|uniref:PaaI family thioesterase n=1 Tax=Roseateles sp. TaxID=1971397 RepID=UPI003BA65F7A
MSAAQHPPPETGVDQARLAAFLLEQFPQTRCQIVAASAGTATIRHPVGPAELRPGGTVSGPVMMTVADVALYVALLSQIGIVPLAVTTNLNINFLRKPSAGKDIIGVCRMKKVGKSLAVGEVDLYSDGEPEPVAHAVGTYAIPRR